MSELGTTLTCVYCGQEYPAGTPAAGSDVRMLTDHIKICEKHPMREAEQKIKRLYSALAALVGESEKNKLEIMDANLRLLPINDVDKANMINAIRLLIEMADDGN